MTTTQAQGRFVSIDASIFDHRLCLDPYPLLEPLYQDPSILGFHSEGMNFCIRYEDCRALIAAHRSVAREPLVTEENTAREAKYAREYPHRAWHFQHGLCNLGTKALFNRFLLEHLDAIDWSGMAPAFERLGRPGRHDDFLDDIELLPLKLMLEAWGFEADDERVRGLHRAGVALNKSFDNFQNETLIAEGDQGLAYSDQYFFDQYHAPAAGTLLADFASQVRRQGLDPSHAVSILVAFSNGLTNTLSISTAFALRNILRYPAAAQCLRDRPELLQSESVILEFLRRDNHVKSLSRQVHAPFTLRGLPLKPGDALSIFYPGVNLDPTHWDRPTELDFSRAFNRDNHAIFGGSRYACIGSRLAMRYFHSVLASMLRALPSGAQLIEEDIATDSSWLTERIITRLPFEVP